MPRWVHWAWVPPAAFLIVFCAIPLVVLGARLVGSGGVALSPSVPGITALAALQAALSTVLALAIGLPMANITARYRFRGRALAQALVTVPFVLPTVVVAVAFRSLLGGSLPQGLLLVVIAHAYVNLAVVARIVGSAWVQLDDRVEVVARTLGASRSRTFWTVTLPALRGPLVASAAVVFVFCFTSLGIVLLLGDGSATRTLEAQVLRQASVLLDFPGAAATALVQLVVVSAVLLGAALVSRRTPRRDQRPAALREAATRAGRITVHAVGALTAVVVLAPVAALVVQSLRVGSSWGLDWWRSIGSLDSGTTRVVSPLATIATSLAYALTTAVAAGALGGLAAIAVLGRGRGRWVAVAAVIPLGVSAATLGLGTLLAFGRPPVDLRGSGVLVPLAHALVAVPLVVAVVVPALRATDDRRMAVAASLGARPTRAFVTAYGPVLRVVIVASAGLAGAVSLGEFGAASFLARTGSPTVPLEIARLLGRPGEASFKVATALAVVLVALTLALVLLVDRLGARRLRVG